MNEMPTIFRLASDAARHAATRQATIAANVANADTPGYRARDLAAFQARHDELVLRRTRPGHLDGGGSASRSFEIRGIGADPNGNTVDLQDQVLRSIEAARGHNRAVTVYRGALDMLRASLGGR